VGAHGLVPARGERLGVKIVRYYPRALVGDGGMTGAVRRWSQSFVNHGAEVTIAFDEGSDIPQAGGVNYVSVRHAGRPGLKIPVGLEDVLRGSDLMILHSGWTLHNLRAAAAARRVGVPYVLEPRGAYDPHIVARKRLLKKGWWAARERKLVMEAHAIHVFFEPERAHLEALGYRGPVIVASNGVETPDDFRWDGGSGGYVLWLGRFDPEHKGLDLLVQGVHRQPAAERPQVRLHGPEWRGRKRRVRELVAKLGVEPWVTVGEPAYGEPKRRLLTEAKGFVYPSRWDACPNSSLESVSIGLPTLMTPYPLGSFVAERGGCVLAEASPDGLARGLRDLTGPGAAAIGAEGARVVRSELSWDAVAKTWLEQAEGLKV
jgi:glycosyltransferase involved in cell wall biosynthesis